MSNENETPYWRVLATAGFFGPDHALYEEGAEIYYDGEPNEELEPLNPAAHKKMIAFLENLEELGKAAAAKAGRPYAGRPRHLDGQLALASAIQKAEMNILGTKTLSETAPRIERSNQEVDQTGMDNPKRGRGRPKGSKGKIVTLAHAAA